MFASPNAISDLAPIILLLIVDSLEIMSFLAEEMLSLILASLELILLELSVIKFSKCVYCFSKRLLYVIPDV